MITYKGDAFSSRKRFIYRGYLQIAELDASTATESLPAILRKIYLWDPSEPTATRILALTTYDATGTYEAELYYTHDAQKNTTALFGIQAGRRAMYQYSAYGSLLKIDGDLATLNPFRFSSEYHDEDLDLIYYNYRYYNPTDGRWINRDPIEEQGGVNLYGYDIHYGDILGLLTLDTLSSTVIQGLAAGKIAEIALLLGYATAADLIAELIKRGYKLKCKECDPPVGAKRQKCDTTHVHNGWKPHYHTFILNQSPVVAGCKCFDIRGAVQNDPHYEEYTGPPRGGGISISK